MFPPEAWLLAAVSTLAGVIGYLGRDLIKQRDAAIAGWREATVSIARLAAALEARNRRDARQRRTSDVEDVEDVEETS